jgi:hypothetical protein
MKPPLKDLRFDVTVRNDRRRARWVLLPALLLEEGWLGPVARLQRTELRGARGKLLIGRGTFSGSFNVLLVPPGGVVTIRGLHTEIWIDELPGAVDYEVVTATEVQLGDEPLRAWFEVDPLAPRVADVKDDRWQLGQHELPAHRSPTGKEVPVRVTEDRRLRLGVPVQKRGP